MANQYTKYTGTLTGQVGSLITALDAALVTGQGWTTPFTGTNTKVYRAPSGLRHYFLVNDNGPGAGGAEEARIRGFSSTVDASDTNDVNHVDPFPTFAQKTNGVFIRKSVTADGTTRNYVIYADARSAVIFIYTGDTAGLSMVYYIGEAYSLNASDSYSSAIAARVTENTAGNVGWTDVVNVTEATYLCRNSAGSAGAVACVSAGGGMLAGDGDIVGAHPFPNVADGALYWEQYWIFEGTPLTSNRRGRLRGLWASGHAASNYADQETRSGSGSLTSKTFAVYKTFNAGIVIVETSASLETN